MTDKVILVMELEAKDILIMKFRDTNIRFKRLI